MADRPQMNREDLMAFILDHREKPRNNHPMDDPSVEASGGNPGCGDIVTIYLRVGEDECVEDISYVGEGCTISQAGASFLTERLKGKTLAEVEEMEHGLITETFGREVMATRPRCATLAFSTAKAAVKKYRDDATRRAIGAATDGHAAAAGGATAH